MSPARKAAEQAAKAIATGMVGALLSTAILAGIAAKEGHAADLQVKAWLWAPSMPSCAEAKANPTDAVCEQYEQIAGQAGWVRVQTDNDNLSALSAWGTDVRPDPCPTGKVMAEDYSCVPTSFYGQ